MAENKYEIDEELLNFFQTMASNKYQPLFSVVDNNAKVLAKKKNSDDLTDLVKRYSRLFSSVVEAVSSQFNSNSILNIITSKDDFLVIYASNIAAKTVVKDLEYALENTIQRRSQNLEKSIPFNKKLVCWGETSYTNVRLALEGMVQHCADSNKNPLESMRDYFTTYANATNEAIKTKIGKDVYGELKDIKWKIGSHEIGGLKPVVVPKNGNSTKKVEEREKEQFYTPLPDLFIPKHMVLPRSRIIGDQVIITDLERMVKCLFMFNKKAGKNAMVERQKFHQNILVEGMPGGGKGEICHYIVDFANGLNGKVGHDLKVTYFEFESSFVDGSIQKLKSQFRQISGSDQIFLIYQDEIDQILHEKGKGKETSNLDVIKEFQKFLQGQYVNKGNYIFLTTTNEYRKLPLAIRERFFTYHWKGAETKEQKADLFGYKLEDGVQAGYIHVEEEEFDKLGELAFQYNLSGRDITNICKDVKAKAFKWESLGEVYKLQDDYDIQVAKVDELNRPVYFRDVKGRLISFIKHRGRAEEGSIKYEAA